MAAMTRRLSVSDEHQHRDLRPLLVDGPGGAQALVGVGRRHAHVHDGHVGPVLLDRLPQRLGVGSALTSCGSRVRLP